MKFITVSPRTLIMEKGKDGVWKSFGFLKGKGLEILRISEEPGVPP
jgi:hypothetical protein